MFPANSLTAEKLKTKYSKRADLQTAILEMESHSDYESTDETVYFTCDESINDKSKTDNQQSNSSAYNIHSADNDIVIPDESAKMKTLIAELEALESSIPTVDRYM